MLDDIDDQIPPISHHDRGRLISTAHNPNRHIEAADYKAAMVAHNRVMAILEQYHCRAYPFESAMNN